MRNLQCKPTKGIANFFNEQAFREGALRGLEGGVAVGEAQSLMQAFNRLGFIGCSLSEALNKTVVRDEWGYQGHIETDAIGTSSTGYKAAFTTMLAAGTDSFCLDTQRQTPTAIATAITENDDGYLLGELRREEHLHAGFQGRAVADHHVLAGAGGEPKHF